MSDVRQKLNDFTNGLNDLGATHGKQVSTFMNLVQLYEGEGDLSHKTKELMSVAIGTFARCEYCIVFHVFEAYKAGATRQEIIEAGMVAVAFGGGPAMAYAVTTLMNAVNEFEYDFKK